MGLTYAHGISSSIRDAGHRLTSLVSTSVIHASGSTQFNLQVSMSMAGEECVFSCQSNWPDRALDGIGINLDASIVKEADEPFPVVETIADRLGKLRTLGDLCQTFLQPRLQRIDDRLRSHLSLGAARLRGASTDLSFDSVQFADAHQRFRRDRRVAPYVNLIELPPHMRPAEGERHRVAEALHTGQLLVHGVAIDLQHAGEALYEGDGVLAASTGGIAVGDGRRRRSSPGAIIASNCPQVAGLGLAASGIEHRATRLVGKQLG